MSFYCLICHILCFIDPRGLEIDQLHIFSPIIEKSQDFRFSSYILITFYFINIVYVMNEHFTFISRYFRVYESNKSSSNQLHVELELLGTQ